MSGRARAIGAVERDGAVTIIAGPCSVESREQLFDAADMAKLGGATMLRGGAFNYRPRNLRSANRAANRPGNRNYVIGLRPARTYN